MKNWVMIVLILVFFLILGLLTYRPVIGNGENMVTVDHTEPVPDKQEKKLIFCSDPWAPYAGYQDSESPGYIVAVLKEIFEAEGYQVSYINLPWTRCIKDTRDGQITALAGADRLEVPDFIFPKHTIGTTRPAFFVRSETDWKFKDISSLEGIVLGVIQDYTYSKEIDQYIQQNQKSKSLLIVKGNDPLDRLIDALQNKRIDVFIENAPVVHHSLRKKNLISEIKEAGYPKAGVRLFVPFSPRLPKATEYAAIFDKGISELRKTGKLQKILDKYEIKDWADDAKRLEKAGH